MEFTVFFYTFLSLATFQIYSEKKNVKTKSSHAHNTRRYLQLHLANCLQDLQTKTE